MLSFQTDGQGTLVLDFVTLTHCVTSSHPRLLGVHRQEAAGRAPARTQNMGKI